MNDMLHCKVIGEQPEMRHMGRAGALQDGGDMDIRSTPDQLAALRETWQDCITAVAPGARHILTDAEQGIDRLEALACDYAAKADGLHLREILDLAQTDPQLVTLANVLDRIYDECADYDEQACGEANAVAAKLFRIAEELLAFTGLRQSFIDTYLNLPGLRADAMHALCASLSDYAEGLLDDIHVHARAYRELMYNASEVAADAIEWQRFMDAGKVEFVMDLVGLGALDANVGLAEGEHRQSLLSCAAAHGRSDVISYLVACGADPNFSMGPQHGTPLLQAAMRADAPTVKALLAAGARIELPDGDAEQFLARVSKAHGGGARSDAQSAVRVMLREAAGGAASAPG